MIQYAGKIGVEGVICGHIHRPEIRQVANVMYLNCGDWVENCTALVEHYDGHIELIRYDDRTPTETAETEKPLSASTDSTVSALARQNGSALSSRVNGDAVERVPTEV
jgi:hypothetical protein